MSTAAVMMVRDEADIIGHTIDWLYTQVDAIYMLDNRSTDGTRELAEEAGAVVVDDSEVGYYQSAKTSALAQRALRDGHAWVIPCDADEIWTAPNGMTLKEWTAGMGPDVLSVRGEILNFVPTGKDPNTGSPMERIQWRLEHPGHLPKVAARTSPYLTIHAGNHAVDFGARKPPSIPGILIRHYSWRSEEQYVRKILNGIEAYAATDLPAATGAHWRSWEGATDDQLRAHFREWFWVDNPEDRSDLVHDPWTKEE